MVDSTATVSTPVAITPALVDIHDRVADAYYGKLGPKFMRETQDRIHWICGQVSGVSVLDVGCSQGITSILLGREGKHVLAIDSDARSIEEANALLNAEADRVKKQVVFTNTDFLTLPAQASKFDTVIISEVLEHLLQPAVFVEAAARCLNNDGVLVVTVPFGINDFIDHKRTYYLSEPYQILSTYFEVTEISVLGKWLGLSGRKRPTGAVSSATLSNELIDRLEKAFYNLERELRQEAGDTLSKLTEANLKYRNVTEQVATYKQRLAQEEQTRKQAQSDLTSLKLLQEKAVSTAHQLQTQRNELTAQVQSLQANLIKRDSELDRLNSELAALAEQSGLSRASLSADLQRTKTELDAIQAERRDIELALTKAQTERDLFANNLQVQDELTAQVQSLQANLLKRDNELDRSRSELAAFSAQSGLSQASLGADLQRTKTELDAIQAERRDIELALTKAQTERDIFASKLQVQEAELKQERKVRQDTLVRSIQLEERNKVVGQQALSAKTEAGALAQRFKKEHAYLTAQHEKLLAQLQLTTSERQVLQQQLGALRSELNVTRDRLHEAAAQHALTHELIETLKFSARDLADAQSLELTRQFEAERRVLADRSEALLAGLSADRDGVQAQLNELQDKHAESQAVANARGCELVALLADRAEALQAEKLRSAFVGSQLKTAREAQQLLSRDLVQSFRASASIETQMQDARMRAGELHADLAAQREMMQKVTSERDTEQALRRSLAYQAEQVKLQLLQSQRAREELRNQLERVQLEKLAAEDRVARTRAMVSFRLGYTLLHGFGSLSAVMKLPGQLWQLHREGQRRRTQQQAKTSTRNAVEKAVLRTPALPLAAPQVVTSTLELPERPLGQALKGLKVACIMDEFTFSSYAPECNLLPLSVDHWQEELEAFTPELLFIESAWRGKDDRWGSKVGHLSSEVTDILAWCRTRQIPTVFWNKEDPIHFETFLTTARLFDHVFTTDIDCIHRYKGALGHDRVYLLPFACQPVASNPIEKYARKDAFCFAGAYYVRYPERTRDLGNFMVNLAEYRPVEIYDRNFGKNDPNYQFPADYQSFIVGTLPFDQIDKAYKGYRYAINLNSIKQSQSMFARRVFELLASNTITISNYSRGVRLLFGDLVVTTDSGQEIVSRLQKLCGDPVNERKFRLAGLRKVMRDHTYQDRLAYVVGKVRGAQSDSRSGLLPTVTMTGYAKNQQQLDALLASFERQTHAERRLLVVTSADFSPASLPEDKRMQLLTAREIEGKTLGDLTMPSSWVAGMVPDDYHGPNYLLDLALATRYSHAQVIGKATHHVWSAQNGLTVAQPEAQYQPTTLLQARCAMVSTAQCAAVPLRDWVTSLYTRQLEHSDMLAVDEFNYCKNGALASEAPSAVNDLEGLDAGLDMATLMARAEAVEAGKATVDIEPVLTGAELAKHFKPATGKPYRLTVAGNGWEVSSELGDGKHEYLYATTDLAPEALGAGQHLKFHLDCTPGLNLQLTVLFLDAHKQRISHVVKPANRNQEATVPAGTAWVRLGLRLYGSGEARINALVLGHRPLRPATVLGRAEHLLLTNHYPSYDDLYRNGFVHSRVTAYRERGVNVDVLRLRKDEGMSYHEYQNVDVMTGSQDALHKLLSTGQYKSVLVHFLDPAMWEVLKQYIDRIKVVVWVHGAEIQPWHRRDFNNDTEAERNTAKAQSEVRMAFWRGLLQPLPSNLRLVFVSRYFAEEVMEDLGFRLPEEAYSIIHNPIDTELFSYQPKPVEQRKKVLSIRPYSSRTYANDLSVEAILLLSKRPCFADMEFRLIGDGKLFDATLEPLRKFSNVVIEKRFLHREEIAALHKNYGIFLCPSRMDTQGVSRDEAMASGLVPVTNKIAAISEFVCEEEGYTVQPESSAECAEAIFELYSNSSKFQFLSNAAHQKVQNISAKLKIINAEIDLLNT